MFPEQAKKQESTRKRPGDQEDSADSGYSGEKVEDVFNLDSGWSVDILGNEDEDTMMEIGEEVRPRSSMRG